MSRQITNEQAEAEAYEQLKAKTIPAEYRRRHDALYRGVVKVGDWSDQIRPVADGVLRVAPWEQIAQRTAYGRTGRCAGRVSDSWTLYRTRLTDGRPVFREVTYYNFGDDQRETYWFPEDVFLMICMAEIRQRRITPEAAREWLTRYRGCVGTELYEVAATLEPAPLMVEE